MLFNTYEFLFVFLPVTLAVFLVLQMLSRRLALGWLIVASLLFYAYWRPINVLIILPSILINFLLARVLLRLGETNSTSNIGNIVLGAGIAFNLSILGYFKYLNFFQTMLNDVAGTDFVMTYVILPLGISFITFQIIAFLIDVHGRRIESFTLRDFCLFVLFFPQLIAGPIVHYREMMPQFQNISRRLDIEGISVGLTLLSFGLFKKVVLADGISMHVSPIYTLASDGGNISLITAWIAAIGFTLQIYFDFSGYSDMAAGLARFFGVRLPLNFDSPLKAKSIIDFWARWHVTLTRFLTAYLFNPMVLWLSRRRMKKRLAGMAGRKPNVEAFFSLLAAPTIFTMFISGLWHGAGYLFIMWGLLHGLYLTINHAWRLIVPRLWKDKDKYHLFMAPIGFFITFVAVVFAMVIFRGPTPDAAIEMLSGMVGLNGISLPHNLMEPLGLVSIMEPIIHADGSSAKEFVFASVWVFVLTAIALLLPNSFELTAAYEPVIGYKIRNDHKSVLYRFLT